MADATKRQKRAKRLARLIMHFDDHPSHKVIGIVCLTVVFTLLAAILCGGPEELFSELIGDILVGVIIAELLIAIIRAFGVALKHYSEDELKLTTNFAALTEQYKKGISLASNYDCLPSPVSYDNPRSGKECVIAEKASDYFTADGVAEFPIIVEAWHVPGAVIEVEDHKERIYEPPLYLQIHMDEIMSAHNASALYNNPVIRVDDFSTTNDVITLVTSRSTYFDSMITNRAMDFHFNDGPTVRQLYEYDLHTPPLSQSRLSNHLGFNGIVFSIDDVAVFVNRSRNMSVGKNTYGTGVAASMKVRYAIDPLSGKLTTDGMRNAMINEIKDELNVKPSELIDMDFSLEQNVVAFYRDLVEGGKPQFLLQVRVPVTFEELARRATRTGDSREQDPALLADGSNIIGVRKGDLKQAVIMPDGMSVRLVNGEVQFLGMVPSASASVAMYLKWEKMYKL